MFLCCKFNHTLDQPQHTTDNVFQMCCKLCLFVAEKLKLDTIVAFSCCKFSHQFDYSHDTTANVRTILDLLNRNDQKKKLLNQQHLFYCPNVVISVYCHPYSVMYHCRAYITSKCRQGVKLKTTIYSLNKLFNSKDNREW